MQTVAFTLTQNAWTEILGGNNSLSLQIRTANKIRLHFSDSATPPPLNAETVLVDSFPPHWDFETREQVGGAHIYARADVTPAEIVVVRKTAL